MILLCGIPTESPLAMVRKALDASGEHYLLLNQRQFSVMGIMLEIADGRSTGRLRVNGDSYPLEEFTAIFTRLMDYRFLPELKDQPDGSPQRQLCRNLLDTLNRWAEVAPARVVNRTAAMGSNFSKPFQAQLIRRFGFEIPETLITNDP